MVAWKPDRGREAHTVQVERVHLLESSWPLVPHQDSPHSERVL